MPSTRFECQTHCAFGLDLMVCSGNAQGTDKVLTQLRDAFDKNFDKFEMYVLRNIFHVPEDLQFNTEDMADVNSDDVATEQQLDADLKQLHEQLAEVSV